MQEIILSGEWLAITGRTLAVSGIALAVAVLLGLPAGLALAVSRRFPARRMVLTIIHTGMAQPPVVVGLVVALSLFRGGPLGFLGWMYTVPGMVIAQTVIALPLVIGLTAAGVAQLDPNLVMQLRSLGASSVQLGVLLLRQAKLSVLAAVMAGFGGALSEVGAVMMVGGNIRGQTRVLTTAVVQYTRQGHFEAAVLLGLVLLTIAFAINFVFTRLQQGAAK